MISISLYWFMDLTAVRAEGSCSAPFAYLGAELCAVGDGADRQGARYTAPRTRNTMSMIATMISR